LVQDLYQYRRRNRRSLFIQRKLPTAKGSDRPRYPDENERPLVEIRIHLRSIAASGSMCTADGPARPEEAQPVVVSACGRLCPHILDRVVHDNGSGPYLGRQGCTSLFAGVEAPARSAARSLRRRGAVGFAFDLAVAASSPIGATWAAGKRQAARPRPDRARAAS
jgi:hypothetical protein